MTNETTSAIDLVLSRIGEEFDGECHLSETEARQIADTITRLQAALNLLGTVAPILKGYVEEYGPTPGTGEAALVREIDEFLVRSVGGE